MLKTNEGKREEIKKLLKKAKKQNPNTCNDENLIVAIKKLNKKLDKKVEDSTVIRMNIKSTTEKKREIQNLLKESKDKGNIKKYDDLVIMALEGMIKP